MNDYLSSSGLKRLAKGQLLGKYGTMIGAYAIHLAIILFIDFSSTLLVDTTTVIGTVVFYIITLLTGLLGGVFLYGEAYMYLKLACNQPVVVNDLFYGFGNDTDKVLKLQFLFTIVGLICGLPNLMLDQVTANPDNPYLLLIFVVLLLITTIFNVCFSLIYSQCFYLTLDFPQYSVKELLRASSRIMKGSKGRLFYIELSFLPLLFLGLISCCLGYLWILPYMQAVKANFYLDLIKKQPSASEHSETGGCAKAPESSETFTEN